VRTPREVAEGCRARGLVGRRRGDHGEGRQQGTRPGPIRALRAAPEPVVADRGAAAWQDVLEEAVEKLHAGQRDVARFMRPIVLIAKRHVVSGHRLQSAVRDRDAEHIAPEIVEDSLTAAGVLGVDHPRRRPDPGRYLVEEPRAAKPGAHLRAKDDRQGLHRHEERGVLRGDPPGAVGGEAARRHEEMDVGMVEHRARPGVEDGETPEARADVARIGGQTLEGRRRAAHEHAVDDALVRERERAQLAWQGEGHEIVRAQQELAALRLEPALGVRTVTRRAVAIAQE
jgi:hypothetical protein